MKEHRWSGWPGAYCLDCGKHDPMEACLASGELLAVCFNCLESWPQDECLIVNGPHDVRFLPCADHLPTECISQ